VVDTDLRTAAVLFGLSDAMGWAREAREARAATGRDGDGVGDAPWDLRGWNCAGGEAKEKIMDEEGSEGGERECGADVERGCDRDREPAGVYNGASCTPTLTVQTTAVPTRTITTMRHATGIALE
jgi:hypothetical protein